MILKWLNIQLGIFIKLSRFSLIFKVIVAGVVPFLAIDSIKFGVFFMINNSKFFLIWIIKINNVGNKLTEMATI